MLTTESAHLKITGFKYHEVIENIFSSLMVDTACIVEANDQYILVVGEKPENRSSEYKSWLKSITIDALEQKGHFNLIVEILN